MASIELKFSGTFSNSDYLKEFTCGICQQSITEQDISQNNYRLWVSDYANEVKQKKFSFRSVRAEANRLWSKLLVKIGRTPRLFGRGGLTSLFFFYRTSLFVLKVRFRLFLSKLRR